jgi:hypothetical protein
MIDVGKETVWNIPCFSMFILIFLKMHDKNSLNLRIRKIFWRKLKAKYVLSGFFLHFYLKGF